MQLRTQVEQLRSSAAFVNRRLQDMFEEVAALRNASMWGEGDAVLEEGARWGQAGPEEWSAGWESGSGWLEGSVEDATNVDSGEESGEDMY